MIDVLAALWKSIFCVPAKDKRCRVVICFRSGTEVVVSCSRWSIKSSDGELMELNFHDMRPKCKFIHMPHVSSVWELPAQ